MRVCVVYDCLFPHTVGGAERWYRNLAVRLAEEGHEVTYLTLRQWPRGRRPDIDPRVRVRVVGPRMSLYAGPRRRILPPLVFGVGVLVHLLARGGRYDVVHTASFPYFSLLAAAFVRPLRRFRLVVDWHEVWSRAYWRDYLGSVGGAIGYAVQRRCVRVPQRAFCFSRLHSRRLIEEGLAGEPTLLEGEYEGSLAAGPVVEAEPVVVFAARMIPEKRAPLGVAAVAIACERMPQLRGVFFGDGPQRPMVLAEIAARGVRSRVEAPGFVASEVLERGLGQALCMLLPSSREGYGLVVLEAASHGTPSIVIAGEDNAATELVQDGVNGLVVPEPEPDAIADAIERVAEGGLELRRRTARWFEDNAERLSLETSLRRVLACYVQRGGRERVRS